MKLHIITHSQIFHADEVIATAILKLAHQGQEVLVTRTRDPVKLKRYAGAPGTFLLDVGGVYDPAKRLFDHHQTEGAGFRDPVLNEWPYATAGLVWKSYGEDAIRHLHPKLEPDAVKEVAQSIDDTVIRYVDAVDCGVRLKSSGPSLSGIIGSFNSSSQEPGRDSFQLVTDLAQVLITNFVSRLAGKVQARSQVRTARTELDGQILVLDACIPWVQVVSEEMPDVKLVVYPTGPVWQVRTAMEGAQRMESRINLPKVWGGLEHDDFVQASGVFDAIFCHRGGHLAGARSYEGIMSLATKALQQSNFGDSRNIH